MTKLSGKLHTKQGGKQCDKFKKIGKNQIIREIY